MTTSDHPIRVMVVDDSAMIRGLLSRVLNAEGDIDVVCTAANGALALERIAQETIDVVLLDVEMPVMNGIETLRQLQIVSPEIPVIMASSLTQEGAETTLTSLSLGAVDFVPKPSARQKATQIDLVAKDLIDKIRTHSGRLHVDVDEARPPRRQPPLAARSRPDVVAIGCSTGGPNALFQVLRSLDPGVSQPILVVQHMPAVFTQRLAKRLDTEAFFPCKEADDGELIRPGHVLVAPGDYHLTVEADGTERRVRLDQNEKVNFCRPSVDVLFGSLTTAYTGSILAVVLTGMGKDGCAGCQRIAASRGTVLVQDRETSAVWGMPGSVYSAGLADAVLPLEKIGPEISRLCSVGAV